jgi:hypothetical protein
MHVTSIIRATSCGPDSDCLSLTSGEAIVGQPRPVIDMVINAFDIISVSSLALRPFSSLSPSCSDTRSYHSTITLMPLDLIQCRTRWRSLTAGTLPRIFEKVTRLAAEEGAASRRFRGCGWHPGRSGWQNKPKQLHFGRTNPCSGYLILVTCCTLSGWDQWDETNDVAGSQQVRNFVAGLAAGV